MIVALPAPLPTLQSDSASGVLIDIGEIPGGGQLHLMRYGEDYEILLGEEQLMGSWASRSEEALATPVYERLGERARHVLIGGLGMGFTLAAARSVFSKEAVIVLAEFVPSVIAWARGPLAHLFRGSLDDPRVLIDMRDVHDVIVGGANAFDTILLDVDNGPDGLVTVANERLYCGWGLRAAHAALRPGGILAVWSAIPTKVSASGSAQQALPLRRSPSHLTQWANTCRISSGLRPSGLNRPFRFQASIGKADIQPRQHIHQKSTH